MLRQFIAILILSLMLAQSTLASECSDTQRLRVLGVVALALSAIGIGATAFGVANHCSSGQDACQKLYWQIIPGSLMLAGGGAFAVLASFFRDNDRENQDYLEDL